jgi:hypothetical protein
MYMTDKQQMFISIMAFYALLSYVIGPLVFYYLRERSLASAGNGFVVGSVVSILLWLSVGSKMVK